MTFERGMTEGAMPGSISVPKSVEEQVRPEPSGKLNWPGVRQRSEITTPFAFSGAAPRLSESVPVNVPVAVVLIVGLRRAGPSARA